MTMAVIIFLASNITTKEDFRLYFLIVLILNVASQCFLQFGFNFSAVLSDSSMEKPLKEESEMKRIAA